MTGLSDLLASLTPQQRCGLSWGDRAGGQHWQARWNERSTIGRGGPYLTAEDAIRAVLSLEDENAR
jgi:hypothetical protein